MRMSRREFGALAAATLLFRAQRANAGAPDVLVFGQDLPANLDPHQILDLGMTGYALNAYDTISNGTRATRPRCSRGWRELGSEARAA
jgi:hypothetical protein